MQPNATGTREQLAAVIVKGSDSFPGPELLIHGTPGDWAVCVRETTLHTWLGSTRRAAEIRSFKTLDAAHAAAVAVAMLAEPASEAMHASVKVTMRMRA